MARAAELKTAYDRLSELNNSAIQHPDDADIRTELAEVCRELGKNDLAEVWDRAAAALREDVDDDRDSD